MLSHECHQTIFIINIFSQLYLQVKTKWISENNFFCIKMMIEVSRKSIMHKFMICLSRRVGYLIFLGEPMKFKLLNTEDVLNRHAKGKKGQRHPPRESNFWPPTWNPYNLELLSTPSTSFLEETRIPTSYPLVHSLPIWIFKKEMQEWCLVGSVPHFNILDKISICPKCFHM